MHLANEPLVSVIMNCYNGEAYLHDAIDSVYSQTYTNWEIIFWDNLSIDSSANIAQSYNGKLKYYASARNTSLGEARFNAVKKATGKYLAFLDCDDLWEDDKLIIQVNAMDDNEEIGFIYSRCELIKGNGSFLGLMPNTKKMQTLPSGNIFNELVVKGCFIAFNSILISKKKYDEAGGFPIHYKNSIDYHLYLNIAHKHKVLAIDKILCQSREHGGNLSYSQYVIGAEESIESIKSFFPDEQAVLGVKYQYANLIVCLLREYKFFRALMTLIKYGGGILVSKRVMNKLLNSR
jgi:glycosyltransferase involved in cell wall biosynthesis